MGYTTDYILRYLRSHHPLSAHSAGAATASVDYNAARRSCISDDSCPVTTATHASNNEPNNLCSTAFGTLPINKSRFNSAYVINPTLAVCYLISQLTVRSWGLPIEYLRPLAFLRLPGFNHKYGYKWSYLTGLHHHRAAE